MAPEHPLLTVVHDGDVALLTLNRPPANALGRPLIDALHAALDDVDDHDSRAVVLASAIPGFFAAGADLKYISTLDAADFTRYRDALRSPLERIAHSGRPSIAAIDGVALGGGLELAMACTLRFVTPSSRLGLPEVKLGLLPGAGGTQRLPRLVGPGRALQMMLTGRDIDGLRAHRDGLAELVEGEDVVEHALRTAATLARYPAAAIEAIISCVDAAVHTPTSGMEVEGDGVVRLFADGHADAGIAAFLDRSQR